MEHPTQITSAYSVCVCEWVGHQSTWQPGSCLLNDVGFIYEVMADVWEGGKKVRWGEIETAWGCDIKISSRWWMSTRATLERTTKRLLCNGWQVISRFVGGGFLCVQLWGLWLSGTSLFIIESCVLPLFMIYKVMSRGVEAWPRKTVLPVPFGKMRLRLSRPHSFQITVHLNHIYMRVKIELLPGYNVLDHVLPSVISRCLLASASWLMGQNR